MVFSPGLSFIPIGSRLSTETSDTTNQRGGPLSFIPIGSRLSTETISAVPAHQKRGALHPHRLAVEH